MAAIAGLVAGALVIGAAGFVAGRYTTPDEGVDAATTAGVTSTAPASAPSPADGLVSQGLALHQAGKLDEAAAIYNQALAVDGRNKFALFNLGQIAHTRKSYDEAIAKYQASLGADAKFGPALYNLGLAFSAKGDRTNAIANFRRFLEVAPTDAAGMFNLGTLLIQDGKNDEGANLIAQAIAIDPSLKPKP